MPAGNTPPPSSFPTNATTQQPFHSSTRSTESSFPGADPVSSYARMMHNHTQQQMENARRTSRRCVPEVGAPVASLTSSNTSSTNSSTGSVDSRSS
ncbi:MAG: hypothetical protein M1824_001324 [Vezdaea acicularis]|nr:MAG: hypothetical protein M1824_001324 [Vezdaea acicularis]